MAIDEVQKVSSLERVFRALEGEEYIEVSEEGIKVDENAPLADIGMNNDDILNLGFILGIGLGVYTSGGRLTKQGREMVDYYDAYESDENLKRHFKELREEVSERTVTLADFARIFEYEEMLKRGTGHGR